jgi:hypothetical protein
VFELLQINEPYRRRGLGKRLVNAVLETARKTSKSFFAVVQPTSLTRDIEKEIQEGMSYDERVVVYRRKLEAATDFFRALGFRRIGSSGWFALAATDPSHSCHGVSAESDYDPPETLFKCAERDSDPQTVSTLPEELRKQDLEDQAILDRIKTSLEHRAVGDGVRQAADDTSTTHGPSDIDDFGNNILHILSTKSKPKSVKWLLDRFPELRTVRNIHGETTLDALEFHLEKARTKLRVGLRILHVSDKFQGFGNESVECLVLFERPHQPLQIGPASSQIWMYLRPVVGGVSESSNALRVAGPRRHSRRYALGQRFGPRFVEVLRR